MAKRIISAEKTAFLKFELENGDARRKKIALQDISRLYREGGQLNAEARNAFEKLINGMVLSQQDVKVVRWCLNALARLGTREESSPYIQLSLKQHTDKPEIVAAAIAALSRMYNGYLADIESLKFVDPTIQMLAALQTTDPKKINFNGMTINIEKADSEILKLALITLGLNRINENIFHPKYRNGEIVKRLCGHDDFIVRQYSVWSILENNELNLEDLGISFSEISKQPQNVQAKLLQLAAEQETNIKYRHEIIRDGSINISMEARSGLAKGLQKTYYDGLEDITIDWFDTEANFEVKSLLAEHFGRYSDDCGPYEVKSLSILEAEPALKSRVLLGSERTRLYGMIKSQELNQGNLDLFGNMGNLEDIFRIGREISTGKKKMKILFFAASPINENRLRLEEEARDLREQLSLVQDKKIEISVQHIWAVRTNQVQMEILNENPSILHFSGHGSSGNLIFENANGEAAPVTAKAISELISLCSSIDCLVLNACFSESVAKLCVPHLKAVIGCDDAINDDAAIAFTRAFYRALAHGQTYEIAYKFAKNEIRMMGYDKEADKYKFDAGTK